MFKFTSLQAEMSFHNYFDFQILLWPNSRLYSFQTAEALSYSAKSNAKVLSDSANINAEIVSDNSSINAEILSDSEILRFVLTNQRRTFRKRSQPLQFYMGNHHKMADCGNGCTM